MPDQIPPDVVAARYERLVALVEEIAWEENKQYAGQTVEVLVAEGEGRKDAATRRLSGRARDNRLVHLSACDARPGDTGVVPRPGDIVDAVVTYAAPHHLVADEVLAVRRTPGGDAWEARTRGGTTTAVPIGMPTLRS
jgi:tRNA-2-methylthio-N6-dimethylallyladenosine synthase